MPRVLILCEFATLNGGERSLLATLAPLTRAGVELLVAAPQGPLAERLKQQDIPVLPWAMTDDRGRRPSQAELRHRLAVMVGQSAPDLLHANSLAMGRLAGPVSAALGLPGLAHLRDIIGLSRQAVADLNQNTRLLAVSAATRAYHVAQGLAAEKVAVLHNGVDLAEFAPAAATSANNTGPIRRELNLPADALLALTIGQIGPRKGQDLLLEAARALRDSWPQLHGLIVGQRCSGKAETREFEQRLREAAARDLPGRIHFLGVRADVARLLREATLLVHPARQEPLGRVLLEAAASACAIVATDVGGTREIFPPACEAALLVPAGDTAALAAAVARLLANPPERARLGAAARRRAVEAFSADQAAAGLLRHYRELLP